MYFSFKPNEGAKLQWKTAIRELARAMDKDDPKGIQKLARLSAKRFVQNVIAVTPPCQGVADQASKARGEQTILSDLLRLAQPVSLAATPRQLRNEVVATEDDLLAVYLAARDPRTGRVNPRNRKQPLYIDQFAFNRVLKKLQSHVGWLAAGLNKAAEDLKAKVPAWIRRHGKKYGTCQIQESRSGIHIQLTQNVPFAEAVEHYPRQWHFALQKEIASLQKQAREVVRYRAKKAGFRLK